MTNENNANGRAAEYAKREQRFRAEADQLGARSRLVSNLRGLTFGVAVVLAMVGLFADGAGIALYVAPLFGVAFLVLVTLHGKVIEEEDARLRWALVNASGKARVTGDWKEFPDDGSRFRDEPEIQAGPADDLDLFGPGSLFQRISVAHTHYGQGALSGFLTRPAEPGLIELRQDAARALVPELETRQRLEALSLALIAAPQAQGGDPGSTRRASPAPPDPEPLLRWAEGDRELEAKPWLLWGARVLPPITVGLAVASYLGLLPMLTWVVAVAVQIALLTQLRGYGARVFAALSETRGAFLRYGPMLEVLENLDLDSQLVQTLRRELLSGDRRPSVAMREFERALGWFELRHNGLIHPIAQAFLMWDVHCLFLLERWQRRSGPAVRDWFAALGEFEALSSLAGFAHDEELHCWPRLVTEPPTRFLTRGLGHPLLEPDQRVTNDVDLPEAGRALLITGSNMSGKSTLMRAMGLAVVMARAGGPACARELTLTPFTLRTSIRIRDSLGGGVSHFYAEIAKLKAVLDAVTSTGKGQDDRPAAPLFFLLDEVLHGTNSRERQIGARWVLRELLRHGAIGAVSTHDLGLCRLAPTLMERVELVHFREDVDEGGSMTFDYKLRQGQVKAGNALRLMNHVGLPVPLEGDAELEAELEPVLTASGDEPGGGRTVG